MDWYYVVVSYGPTGRFLGYVEWSPGFPLARLTTEASRAARHTQESHALDTARRARLDGLEGDITIEQRRF